MHKFFPKNNMNTSRKAIVLSLALMLQLLILGW